ncbi:MAG: hypothetical protein M0Q12_06240 [Synergistaceae bacterium]|jgi:hypothetical protein|nr:hypothetical protein [Synergistaceae bacterium]
MKSKPKNATQPKTRYVVEIGDQRFTTFAVNAKSAISNAAYRYAARKDRYIQLVQWEIKSRELECRIIEGKQ